jgi:hypothetical protein
VYPSACGGRHGDVARIPYSCETNRDPVPASTRFRLSLVLVEPQFGVRIWCACGAARGWPDAQKSPGIEIDESRPLYVRLREIGVYDRDVDNRR